MRHGSALSCPHKAVNTFDIGTATLPAVPVANIQSQRCPVLTHVPLFPKVVLLTLSFANRRTEGRNFEHQKT